MQPLYQGQIDIFCAVYAVLNGLRLTHALRTLTARSLFHATLLELAQKPDVFKDVLEQKTDYYQLVDEMLLRHSKTYPLVVKVPFAQKTELPAPERVWECLNRWFDEGPSRAVLLRFVRFLPLTDQPYIHHWSCAKCIEDNTLLLFDSSRDEGAIHSIAKNEFVTDPREARAPRVLIETQSLHLIASGTASSMMPRSSS